MNTEQLQQKRENIQGIGLDALANYLQMPVEKLEEYDATILKHLYSQAKLGMSFEKEMNINKRSTDRMYLNITKLIAENKEELKTLLQQNLPQYFKN